MQPFRRTQFKPILLAGVGVALALVLLGWVLIPATNPISVASSCAVLVLYGAAFFFGLPRVDLEVVRWAWLFGLLAGAVFATEILLEYALLPRDNSSWGVAEFGFVFALYFFSSFWVAYRDHKLGIGVLTAVLSAMVSSLIWLIIVLMVFYIFRGTQRQVQVFLAEGDYADFTRTGMMSFDTFIMEDLLGAAFFHLLLGPAIAALLGVIGGTVGKPLGQAAKRNT